jgi:hypothetical protein
MWRGIPRQESGISFSICKTAARPISAEATATQLFPPFPTHKNLYGLAASRGVFAARPFDANGRRGKPRGIEPSCAIKNTALPEASEKSEPFPENRQKRARRELDGDPRKHPGRALCVC